MRNMTKVGRVNPFIQFRQLTGATQSEIADTLGVSIASISKYESGDRRPKYHVCLGLERLFRKKDIEIKELDIVRYFKHV